MGLDIRIPLGLIFILIGTAMTVFGLLTQGSAIYDRSMGVNLNMGWGGIMLIFGAVMFFFGRRQRWQDDPVGPRPWERGRGIER